MKIVITGHTKGLGKTLYDHFVKDSNNTVIGFSRSQGTDIKTSIDSVIAAAENCDLFISNAYADRRQIELVKHLNNRVKMLVVSGSQGGFFNDLIPTDYGKNKKDLAEVCHLISLDKNSNTKILHLDLSCLEGNIVDIDDPNNLKCDYTISFNEVVDTVDFWIRNPSFNNVRFNFKITDLLYDQISTKMKTKPQLDQLVERIKQAVDKSV